MSYDAAQDEGTQINNHGAIHTLYRRRTTSSTKPLLRCLKSCAFDLDLDKSALPPGRDEHLKHAATLEGDNPGRRRQDPRKSKGVISNWSHASLTLFCIYTLPSQSPAPWFYIVLMFPLCGTSLAIIDTEVLGKTCSERSYLCMRDTSCETM